MRIVYFIFFVAIAVSCTNIKRTAKETMAEKPKVQTPYRIDTTGEIITLLPDSGCSLRLNNIQVYVTMKSQPGVKVSIISPNGETKQFLLPQLQNMDYYSFGGPIEEKLVKPGGKAVIEISDPSQGKRAKGRVIALGFNEK